MAREHSRHDPGRQQTENRDADTAVPSTGLPSGVEEASGIKATPTAAQWDKANKDLCTLLSATVSKAWGAPACLVRKFKSRAFTGSDGQRIWRALMIRYKYKSEETSDGDE